ncbi:NADH:flavin oxidoreductase/NADH oxidase [Rathayibacter sp. ZW T2_19]|uniref:NADH:flavin oxidoreductase/NADH oxidase n=1 Tax=Rathayibacter rubneri TaxID=2950106 RepID=A0A9X2E459_9MICO|nr:NADH:flavin oxidoreductase/NADH oxidase [Rathayibacter rubneri]MCM6764041.1 NADH:flavin oxidoreductase/NADH oxidase [Rathayibacter rubneri]
MSTVEDVPSTAGAAVGAELFDPLVLRGTRIPNRLWLSPMCTYASEDEDGIVGDWHLAHYGQFALGGAGLVVTEATAVLPEGRVTPQDAGLWSDAHIDGWRRVTDLVHAQGSVAGVQLAHAGRKGGKYRGLPGDAAWNRSVPLEEGGWSTLGATGEAFGRYARPRAASTDELTDVVAAFAAAARRADAAGFDVVELHGAHGYLLHEFLSPAANLRSDEWGGPHRARLLLECVRAVRAVWPAHKPLFVRLSVDDVAPGGTTAVDTAALARTLVGEGVDLIDCSSGGLSAGAEYSPAPGYQVPGARTVRSLGGVPVSAVGLITAPSQAAEIVASGSADAVMLGRELLRNPHFPRHAAAVLGTPLAPHPRYHRAWT